MEKVMPHTPVGQCSGDRSLYGSQEANVENALILFTERSNFTGVEDAQQFCLLLCR